MAAPKGNQFWKARSSHGRKPKFANAEDLWAACEEYFEWVELNPVWEARPFSYQGKTTDHPVPKMRAMTLDGLCIFLGVAFETWSEWRSNRNDFSEVITRVEMIIREQKFTGAAADLLNPNIIARDLGLVEKKKIDGSLKVEAVDVMFHRAPDDASDP